MCIICANSVSVFFPAGNPYWVYLQYSAKVYFNLIAKRGGSFNALNKFINLVMLRRISYGLKIICNTIQNY